MSAKQHFLLCCIHSQSKIKHFVPFWRTSFSLDQSKSQLKKKVASRIDLQSIIEFLETSWARHKWKFYFKESICTNWVSGFNPDPASSSRLDDSVRIGMFPVMLKLGKIVERKKKQNYWIQRNAVHTLAWSGIPGDSKKKKPYLQNSGISCRSHDLHQESHGLLQYTWMEEEFLKWLTVRA